MVIASDIGSALADDEPADVVAVAGADACHAIAIIEQRKPTMERLHEIGAECTRVYKFNRIEGKVEAAKILACDAVEVGGGEWTEGIVSICGMIENDRLHPGSGPDEFHECRPLLLFEIRRNAAGADWKRIKMTFGGGDFIANDGGKIFSDVVASGAG